MHKDRLVVAALVGWLFVGLLSAAPQLVPGPSARFAHSMAYDSQRQVVVLFGGLGQPATSSALSNETWEWDGVAWSQISSNNQPSPRGFGSMCYDSNRGVCVYFGGWDGSVIDETWEWDGQDWVQVVTSPCPPKREYHAGVYDASRGVVVVHGGADGSGTLHDTWEYDGVNWAQVSTNGPSRENAAYAYDASGQHMLLHGGTDGAFFAGDTYTWDGVAWTVVTAVGPSLRHLHMMTYDVASGSCFVFGGRGSGNNTLSDMWQWDGANWVQVSLPTALRPPGSVWISGAGAYDGVRGETVMFGGTVAGGGTSVSGETWAFDGTEWLPKLVSVQSAASTYGVGCGLPALVLTPQAPPVLGATAAASITNAPAVPSWPGPLGGVSIGFSDTFYGGLPLLPISLAAAGMPGCELLHSNDVFGLPVALGSSPGTWDFSLPIPANVNLLNSHVYLQAFAGAPGYNAAQFIVSNGVDWLIGNQ